MDKLRFGKIEKRLLMDAYQKTVLKETPKNWTFLYTDGIPIDYTNRVFHVEIYVNYFDLEASTWTKAAGNYSEMKPRLKDGKEYRKARANLSRIMDKLESKGMIKRDLGCIRSKGTAFTLTENGKNKAVELLNVNSKPQGYC